MNEERKEDEDGVQQTTNGLDLRKLIENKEWDKVCQFLSSSDEKTKQEDGTNLSLELIQRAVFETKDECKNRTALHLACKYAASVDVIKMLVDIGGKDLVMAKDKENRTALHTACCWNGASVDVMKMLVDIGGKELVMAKNKTIRTSLHYACWHGVSVDFIKMLVDIGGEKLVMAKSKGNRTVLHDLCDGISVEAHIIEVLDVLVNSGVSALELFTAEANRGDEVYSPIHFLMENKLKNKKKNLIHFLMENKLEIKEFIPIKAILHLQSLWYEKDPLASNIPDSFSKTLQKIQNLSNNEDRDKILEGSFIRAVLNQKVVKVSSLFVLFTDLIMQVALMVAFSVLVKSDQKISESVVAILVPSFVWFAFRELAQLLSFKSALLTYASDPSNYVDLLQLGLVFHALVSFSNNVDPMMLIVCIGVSWSRLVIVSANLINKVSVFVSALVAITKSLFPFLYVTSIIVMAFGHMFYVAGPPNGITCDEYDNGGWTCRLSDSYFQSFAMLLSGDWFFLNGPTGVQSVLALIFAFLIGILLLNIIIALISNIFTDVEKDGQKAFWLSRLRFVNELESMCIIRNIRNTFSNSRGGGESVAENTLKEQPSTENKSSKARPERRLLSELDMRNYQEWIDRGEEYKAFLRRWLGYKYDGTHPSLLKRLCMFIEVAEWQEIIPPSKGFRKVLMRKNTYDEEIKGLHLIFVAWIASFVFLLVSLVVGVIGLILGFFTGGYFWPREFREFLFYGDIEDKKSYEDEKVDKLETKVDKLETKVDTIIELLDELKNRKIS